MLTARVDDNDLDHRFFYGRLQNGKWQLHEIAKAGGHLYTAENDYTGLAALDPNNPNRLYISTNIDPLTSRALSHYELFEGKTTDRGRTWSWLPVTKDSTVDNLRPIVPRSKTEHTMLVWMRGTYTSYTDYDTRIMGVLNPDPTVFTTLR